MTVVFIHGLGETPEIWDYQVRNLPAGYSGITVNIPGLSASGEFSLSSAADHIIAELNRRGIGQAHFCGLSLGSIIALQLITAYPQRVSSLMLAAAQVRMPRKLIAVQRFIMRLLPEKRVAPPGLSKVDMLHVLDMISDIDFTSDVTRISVPTLIVCGAKDRFNLPASRRLAQQIPGAQLEIINDAGHQCHIQQPEKFAAVLHGFLTRDLGY